MKSTRILPILVIGLLAVSLSTTSCRKYEDGPTFSLRSKTARVVNDWKAFLVARNNIEETELYNVYDMAFNENGTMSWTIQLAADSVTATVNADWELASVKEQIKLTFKDTPTAGETTLLYMDILRLMEDEIWLRFLSDGDYYDVRFR
ncbi:MAG: hypothetical protein AAFR61_10270 [Bacteroidota bacterium]